MPTPPNFFHLLSSAKYSVPILTATEATKTLHFHKAFTLFVADKFVPREIGLLPFSPFENSIEGNLSSSNPRPQILKAFPQPEPEDDHESAKDFSSSWMFGTESFLG